MQIIKTEKVHFSECEMRCVEMTITLMEGIINTAHDPDLVKIADAAYEKLTELYEYVED